MFNYSKRRTAVIVISVQQQLLCAHLMLLQTLRCSVTAAQTFKFCHNASWLACSSNSIQPRALIGLFKKQHQRAQEVASLHGNTAGVCVWDHFLLSIKKHTHTHLILALRGVVHIHRYKYSSKSASTFLKNVFQVEVSLQALYWSRSTGCVFCGHYYW